MPMYLNEQQLLAIEEYAGLFYTPKEIAIILQVPIVDLLAEIKNERSDAYLRFYKGRLLKEAAVRKSIINLATQGSSPAQLASLKLFNDSKVKLHEK